MIDSKSMIDISTVVSILPIDITETKPGLIPGEFKFHAVEPGDIFLLPIPRCHHPVYLDDSRPSLLVPDPSDEVAASIANDYKQASLLYTQGKSEPGLDWVVGGFTNSVLDKEEFKDKHSHILKRMEKLQTNWFEAMVKDADDVWAQERRHIFISDLSRLAAVRLGLNEKEWLIREQIEQAQTRCKFCYEIIHQKARICSSCHADLTMDTYRNVVTHGEKHGSTEIQVSQDSGSGRDRETRRGEFE